MEINIQEAETKALVELYNKLTGKSIKKFADRKTAEKRLGELLKKANLQPKKSTKKRIMRFCFAPGGQKDLKEPKKGSLREKLFQMLKNNKEVLFSHIQKEFNWGSRNTYEALRLIHFTTNYGMWSIPQEDDIIIRLIENHKEYTDLIAESKKKAA